ncbi:MAG: DUF4198 domain-containing protein [Desulfobacterales bacterium]|nr:DUF4198 domain-containing protein [Desulfobacterales bacterium]
MSALHSNVEGHGVGHRILGAGAAVLLEFRYSTGEPLSYAEVLIWSPNDNKVEFQNGRTDRNGRFAFAPSEKGIWRVEASDGRGHKATAVCRIDRSETAALTDAPGGGPTGSKALAALLGVSLIANAMLGVILKRRT